MSFISDANFSYNKEILQKAIAGKDKNVIGIKLEDGKLVLIKKEKTWVGFGEVEKHEDSGYEEVRNAENAIIETVTALLEKPNVKPETIELAELCLKQYTSNEHLPAETEAVRNLDKKLFRFRNSDPHFENKKNQLLFTKWTEKYGFPKELFNEPELVDFMEKTQLHGQIKTTRDTIKIENDKPLMLVEGQWKNWSEIHATFEIVKFTQYQGNFIQNKETGKVYTYLDNGKGLQEHHPYENISSVTQLNDVECTEIMDLASQFKRDGTQNYTCVLQIILPSTAKDPKKASESESKFSSLIIRPKHPAIRFMFLDNPPAGSEGPKKGEVYSAGWISEKTPFAPLATMHARIHSPDPVIYLPFASRVATYIPVTRSEAEKALNFTKTLQHNIAVDSKSYAFNYTQQNCTVYLLRALEQANIQVPATLSAVDLGKMVTPEIVKTVIAAADTIASAPTATSSISREYSILSLAESLVSNLILPVAAIILGGKSGSTVGKKIPKSIDDPSEVFVRPLDRSISQILSKDNYPITLPGLLQYWMLNQSSTVVFSGEDTSRFNTVPKK